MEARDARPTHRDDDPRTSVRRHDPVDEPGGDYAELHRLLEQAIRHLEGSDFRSASAKLERACDRAASLWDGDEPSGPACSRTPQVRHANAGPGSGGPETPQRHKGPHQA